MTFRSILVVGVLGVSALSPVPVGAAESRPKPSIDMRASPQVSFSPARIVLTGELKNVTNEDANLYCPTVIWEWGDGTQSEHTADCQPFEPGTSEVKQRYVQQHTFDTPGRFRVTLRLMRGSQVLLSGSVMLTVRPGGNVAY